MSTSSQNRSTNGRFKKGVSGNQAGRPPGSRNQASLAVEQILQGEAELLTRKAIELAAQGNMSALRLCMERILPVRKERSIELEFRPMQNANDLPVNFRDIPTAVAEGRITPSEGESLPTILGSHARALELVELDRRVQTVESHVPALESQTQTLESQAQALESQ